MAKIFSAIEFTGNESPKELAQKLMDLQRQLDAKISYIDRTVKNHEVRISETEN